LKQLTLLSADFRQSDWRKEAWEMVDSRAQVREEITGIRVGTSGADGTRRSDQKWGLYVRTKEGEFPRLTELGGAEDQEKGLRMIRTGSGCAEVE